jgi:hypothetical protein
MSDRRALRLVSDHGRVGEFFKARDLIPSELTQRNAVCRDRQFFRGARGHQWLWSYQHFSAGQRYAYTRPRVAAEYCRSVLIHFP